MLRERLELLTWGSGIGSRWAERRTTITGSEGAHVEAASLWVHVDLATGRPRKLDQRFTDAYSAAIGGREVGARLRHGDAVPDVTTHAWTSRFADFDVVGHVNNAIYWAMVEEHLDLSVPGRLTVEFRGGIDRDQPVVVAVAPDRHSLWVLAEGSVAASAVLHDP